MAGSAVTLRAPDFGLVTDWREHALVATDWAEPLGPALRHLGKMADRAVGPKGEDPRDLVVVTLPGGRPVGQLVDPSLGRHFGNRNAAFVLGR